MVRAYQPPARGIACGLPCAQIPNLASRNQLGERHCFAEVAVGASVPRAIGGRVWTATLVALVRTRASRGVP